MVQTYIYAGIAFIVGFGAAWIIRTITLMKLAKLQKSTQGYLESERLMKETLQKENVQVHQFKMAAELEHSKKLKQAEELNKILDEDILLLQRSNEETEALLLAGEPEIHALKIRLLEAQNTIARFRAQLGMKEISTI
ncbi:MAG: hypothetical protein V4725_10195 [Bacteroidota bacterium]